MNKEYPEHLVPTYLSRNDEIVPPTTLTFSHASKSVHEILRRCSILNNKLCGTLLASYSDPFQTEHKLEIVKKTIRERLPYITKVRYNNYEDILQFVLSLYDEQFFNGTLKNLKQPITFYKPMFKGVSLSRSTIDQFMRIFQRQLIKKLLSRFVAPPSRIWWKYTETSELVDLIDNNLFGTEEGKIKTTVTLLSIVLSTLLSVGTAAAAYTTLS